MIIHRMLLLTAAAVCVPASKVHKNRHARKHVTIISSRTFHDDGRRQQGAYVSSVELLGQNDTTSIVFTGIDLGVRFGDQ